ncbi:MAG: ATPase, T2SS/T4P/T4SS family [Archaeoglobaceae archaeon]
MRQRPEYIIVGEVRGRETLTLFQAMATGHTTYSALHDDSVSGDV